MLIFDDDFQAVDLPPMTCAIYIASLIINVGSVVAAFFLGFFS